MKKTPFVIVALFTALFAQAGAQVLIDAQSIASGTTSLGYTFNNLTSNPITSSSSQMIPTGSLTAAANLAGDSFTINITAVDNWVYGTAFASADLNGYIGGLNGTNFNGNNGGWGVNGTGVSNSDAQFDSAGEALVFTFDLSGMSGLSDDYTFELTNFGAGLAGTDELNYMIVDVSGNTIIGSAASITSTGGLALDAALQDGDKLIVGYVAGDKFKFSGLTVNVTAVPEPGTYALLAGCLALTSVMLRRRRS